MSAAGPAIRQDTRDLSRARNPHKLDFIRDDGDEIAAAHDTYHAALVDVLGLFAAMPDADAPEAVGAARRARSELLRLRMAR